MSHPSPLPVPVRVVSARSAATAAGFPDSSTDAVGRLLRTLVGAFPAGHIAESGTGFGVGTAWMHDGLAPTARLTTVERDATRCAAARVLFAGDSRVTVLHGDWRLLAQHAPFDLLFCDGGGKRDDPDEVVRLLATGGVLVLDDFTASLEWPPRYDGAVDELRLTYLTHPNLRSVEVGVGGAACAVIATRRTEQDIGSPTSKATP